MNSIRYRLLVWLLMGAALAVAGAAIGTYLRARDEANALFDYQLKQMAASLTDAPFAAVAPGSSALGAADALVVQIWDRNGVQLFMSQPRRVLPQHAQLGFTTVATEHGEWRVFSTLAEDQVVQVAQPMSARRELAASMALRTIVPLLAALPFLALFAWFTIARGLSPLNRVADAVARRSPVALEPLSEAGLPSEVRPLVHALNGLLERLDQALVAQRSFIADAAHELRTPLTAVHLQAQLAERATTDADRSAALTELKGGLERATRLSEQLLALAREEPGVSDRVAVVIDLGTTARTVVADLAPLAAAKGIDLGLNETQGVQIRGDADAIATLVSNLVDNAVRYTPSGGRVDVVVTPKDGAATIEVRDNGPGISLEDRERVFDRFYRGAAAHVPAAAVGSGLGLAIVRRIADRHDATVTLGPGLGDKGLGVTVRFAQPSP
ncbi:MAG: HAMP domain-containing protein [Betaproteobacteria bacterium]|nr:MAG: HAMP domain-containing protein [Betaproteobacteria bacterium]